MNEAVLNIDGIRIAFTRRGNGPALVLLHGYPLDRQIWMRMAVMLESDFDLIIPDLRGFGASDVMEADRSIMAYATDLAGLLADLKLKRVHVVGHSMGGYIALAFARQFRRQVAGLGLVATQVGPDSAERKVARHELAEQIMTDGVANVAEGMSSKLSPLPSVQALVHSLISKQRPLGLAVALDAMAGRLDSTDVLRSMTEPVVIVHGAADELIPVERAREMKVLVPSAHYLELPDAGHMPMMEDAAAVAEALRSLGLAPDGS